MLDNADSRQLDDVDRAALGLLIQAVEMQPNSKSRDMTEAVTKLMEFLEKRTVVSFINAQAVFDGLDTVTKANVLRDAKRLAIQFAGAPNVHASVEKLMTRLRDKKKQGASRPGLLGAINRN